MNFQYLEYSGSIWTPTSYECLTCNFPLLCPQIKAKLGTTYVPILNTPRKSFRLRLETVYFLDKHGITAEDLTFVSDLDLRSLIPKPGGDLALAVTLVDHHVLSEVEACLEPYVIQVFDHRPQEGSLPDR